MKDVELKLVKRDSWTLETHAGVLHPRAGMPSLPCGMPRGDGQSDVFAFTTTQTMLLFWNFGTAAVNNRYVKLMRFNLDGKNILEKAAWGHRFTFSGSWAPLDGELYYLQVSREANIWIKWTSDLVCS